jgi:hypothetical protein
MPQGYLSTDPNAGTPADTSRYLSTDPDAGAAPAAPRDQGDPTSGLSVSPIAVAAADLVRRGAVRAGMELATSPAVAKVASKAAGPLASRVVGTTVGAIKGGPVGAVIGNTLGEAAAPVVQQALTGAARGGGSFLARLAGGRVAQALTGPIGMYAALLTARPQPDPDSPVMRAQAERQRQIEAEFIRRQMNLPPGRTTDIDLPKVPTLTRDAAMDEVRKAASGQRR